MSPALRSVESAGLSLLARHFPHWLESGWSRLYPFRPRFQDWHFWAVQGLVVPVAAFHSAVEALGLLGRVHAEGPGLYLVPISLYFVPVVYAALNFGLQGALATTAWCTVLSLPNLFLFHDGFERLGVLIQLVAVNAIGVFVGHRVDREMGARRRAEAAGVAFRASETKYRGLFESSPAAILVLDPDGVILEANPAAGVLFQSTPERLSGRAVAGLIGGQQAAQLLGSFPTDQRQRACLVPRSGSGTQAYLEPALTCISEPGRPPLIQVLFRDVTEEQQRQAGLRAYAAHIVRAQEEERKRIAQELHDETVQQVVLLCRQLDSAEAGDWSVPPEASEKVAEARRTAEQVVTELRDFARALRPPSLEDLGLVTAVQRLLADLSERARVEATLEVAPAERRLGPDAELGLFRIAQEALHNAERHAAAMRVVVTITFGERDVRLTVADDGRGFTVPGSSDYAAAGKLGLLGMRERAESLGGSLEIRSSPQAGTRITVCVPDEPGVS